MAEIGWRRLASALVLLGIVSTACGSSVGTTQAGSSPLTSTVSDVLESSTVSDIVDAPRNIGLLGPVIRHTGPDWDSVMLAGFDGFLWLEGNCLSVGWHEYGPRHSVVWPAGTMWDAGRLDVVLPTGDRLPVGSLIEAGGGFLDLAALERYAGPEARDLAAQCVDSRWNEIAIVNNVPDGARRGGDGLVPTPAGMAVTSPTPVRPGTELALDIWGGTGGAYRLEVWADDEWELRYWLGSSSQGSGRIVAVDSGETFGMQPMSVHTPNDTVPIPDDLPIGPARLCATGGTTCVVFDIG